MLTTLSTLKSRLSILDTDTTNDALLTSAIISLSGRFDKETNRTLARTVSATQEFPGNDTEILLVCYPVETVTKFETKSTELEGWQERHLEKPSAWGHVPTLGLRRRTVGWLITSRLRVRTRRSSRVHAIRRSECLVGADVDAVAVATQSHVCPDVESRLELEAIAESGVRKGALEARHRRADARGPGKEDHPVP